MKDKTVLMKTRRGTAFKVDQTSYDRIRELQRQDGGKLSIYATAIKYGGFTRELGSGPYRFVEGKEVSTVAAIAKLEGVLQNIAKPPTTLEGANYFLEMVRIYVEGAIEDLQAGPEKG